MTNQGRRVFLFALAIWVTTCCAAPAGAAERQRLKNHLPSAVATTPPAGRVPPTQSLHLAIGLPLRNSEALHAFLNDLHDPASPIYGKYLTPQQFTERFGPTEKDYSAVKRWATSNQLKVTTTHPNRLVLDVEGAAADVEKAFQLTLRLYQHPKENRKFFAPDTEPSLDLSVPIQNIEGLDDFALPHPQFHLKAQLNGGNASPNPGSAPQDTYSGGNAFPNSGSGSGPNGTFRGNDFRAAYVPGTALTGDGQTVGLLQFEGFYTNDIAVYAAQTGLPNIPVTVVPIDGGVATPGNNNIEVCLDIEMVMSMAPGVSNIYVYEAPNPSPWVDLLSRMANDNLSKQFSCSWTGGGPNGAAENIFLQMAAQGQSFFTASGDGDAFAGSIPFPSESPNITQVGGTTLTTSGPGGSWVSETVWQRGGNVGTGGGISTTYTLPSYQTGISMTANQGSTTMRNIPDVALTADNVYVTYNNGFGGSVGGTSCAAPLWAGFMALVNQQAATFNHPYVGFLNPVIYSISTSTNYAAAMHDITTGNNTNSRSPTKFYAVNGYDLCTGWGTPAGVSLINLLAIPDPLTLGPANGFSATGNIGGPFDKTRLDLTLTNNGLQTLSWSAASTSPWLDISKSNGTLAAGETATVSVSLNAAASNLLAGTYSGTIWFTNLNTSIGQPCQFNLTVLGAPVITSQPTDHHIFLGDTTTFNVGITGGTPLHYQWRKNAVEINGATNSTLVISNAQNSDVATYSVVITNIFGSTNSTGAVLTVTTGYVSVITFDELLDTINGYSIPNGYASLNWTNFEEMDGLSYPYPSGYNTGVVSGRNVAYNNFGAPASISSAAPFNFVSAYLTAAWFSNQVITANGYRDGVLVYSQTVNIALNGPTLVTFNFDEVTQVRFQSDGVQLVMDNATVVLGPVPPLIITQPPSPRVRPGETASLTVLASGSGPLYYQWQKDGSIISNATSSSYTITNAQISDSGNYSVIITNQFGSITSSNAIVTVDTKLHRIALLAVTYTWWEQDVIDKLVGTGKFAAADIDALDVSNSTPSLGDLQQYAAVLVWKDGAKFFDATNLGNVLADYVDSGGGLVVGCNAYYTNLNAKGNLSGRLDSTDYMPVLKAPGAPFMSYLQMVKDLPLHPILQNVNTFYGDSVHSLRLLYTNLTSGATQVARWADNTILVAVKGHVVVLNMDPPSTDSGWWTWQAGTDGGMLMANSLLWSGGAGFPPQIFTQPSAQTVTLSGTANFTAAASGTSPMSYQWLKDGLAISGATSSGFSITNVQFSDAGNYSVIVTNDFGSATSAKAVLTVLGYPPTIAVQPSNHTVLVGADASFSVVALGTPSLSYQWRKNGVSISAATASTFSLTNVQASDFAAYSVVVTNNYGSVTSADAVLAPAALPGQLDHFAWSPIASPQYANLPFAITITALDGFNNPATNAIGPISLTGLASGAFSDDFEDRDFSDWTSGSDSVTRMITNSTAAGGTNSFTIIGGNNNFYGGISHNLFNLRPDQVSFYVRSSAANLASGYFVLADAPSGPATATTNTAVFFFMQPTGKMGLVAATNSTVPYVANQWYKISLAFNWTNRTVDYYVDDVLRGPGVSFRNTNVTKISIVHLFNFGNAQAWWDQIQIGGTNSPSLLTLLPTTTGPFSNAVWTGSLSVLGVTATNAVLQATDNLGHIGSSIPFNVLFSNFVNFRITNQGDGSFQLSFGGIPSRKYRIQYRDSLSSPNWLDLVTNTPDPLGEYQFVDRPPSGAPSRFYRAISP